MPVVTHRSGRSISHIALAPIERDGRWIGAAGVTVPLDERVAGTLSGLTRAGVVLIADSIGPVGSTLDSTMTLDLTTAVAQQAIDGIPREVRAGRARVIAVATRLDGAGTAIFARRLDEELAVLPELRRVAAFSAAGALLLALALGAALASQVARPVQQLAGAAAAFGAGDLDAPIMASRIREVDQVGTTFSAMRRALATRLTELRDANAALTDRNARLTALQADLMQRDRLVAAGRLVAQLAHEIRNPVASLRNCLELIRRRVEHDAEAKEFTDLAINELLRMHELAEQMLDIARPRGAGVTQCKPAQVARDVAKLASIGNAGGTAGPDVNMEIVATGDAEAAIAPDALKQVLVNLVQNARDAGAGARRTVTNVRVSITDQASAISLDFVDDGPGIPADILPRVFDPFFTTKEAVHGVGLGLFVAEGLVRAAGGTITARNGSAPHAGAAFHIELPRVS
jgi:signal transduction histidine kinase